jgi:hypothetical protein
LLLTAIDQLDAPATSRLQDAWSAGLLQVATDQHAAMTEELENWRHRSGSLHAGSNLSPHPRDQGAASVADVRRHALLDV